MSRCLCRTWLCVLLVIDLPYSIAHGWTSMRNEYGETIESRNSVAWKNGAGYPNPQGMSQTDSPTRPMRCGGLGQNGFSTPEHDSISAPDALRKAKGAGFATRMRNGSRFTLQNFITANHGGVAALYYSCPHASVDSPEEYKALNWKPLTPIKDSYPESKRNGIGYSDKMPEWYGFAGSVCNFGAGYTGGVIKTCDDCQLRYGGQATTSAWNAEKPPLGAPLGTGQLATIVEIEYQLPADFVCPHAVFSWIWHTPHLCIPKEVADKRAENDFWAFCGRNLEGFYGSCRTDWQDEIFTNCMDAEVSGVSLAGPESKPESEHTSDSESEPEAEPESESESEEEVAPSYTPSPRPDSAECVPIGDCSAYAWCDQNTYRSWCLGRGNACPTPFCSVTTPKVVTLAPAPVSITTAAPTPRESPDCVASLESYYKDASTWEPYCKQVADTGICPSPMCKRRVSMLVESRKHQFLGPSLIQIESGVEHYMSMFRDGDEL